MAPERTDGPGAAVDARTDLYSLGATLHSLLTGHPPFHGSTAAELIDAIRLDGAAMLDAAVVEAPKPLGAILRRAMAKRPQDRYQSAKLLLKELEGLARTHEVPL
jgi:eukaryotic-like serine/threonine-protein kinase